MSISTQIHTCTDKTDLTDRNIDIYGRNDRRKHCSGVLTYGGLDKRMKKKKKTKTKTKTKTRKGKERELRHFLDLFSTFSLSR